MEGTAELELNPSCKKNKNVTHAAQDFFLEKALVEELLLTMYSKMKSVFGEAPLYYI